MTKPLTKQQLAEMRERFMLGEYTVEDVQDVFERLEEADLATAKLATSEICECVYDDSWKTSQDVVTGACVYNKKCPNCTNGVVYSDERARELLERLKLLERRLEIMCREWREAFGGPDENRTPGDVLEKSEELLEAIRAARAKGAK